MQNQASNHFDEAKYTIVAPVVNNEKKKKKRER
jgi:hypothetical protein